MNEPLLIDSKTYEYLSSPRYFNKRGNGEWLPNTLMPLSFDRASEAKIGVFYAKFNGNNGNNDHLVVRMVNKNRKALAIPRSIAYTKKLLQLVITDMQM